MKEQTPDYIYQRALSSKENADKLVEQSKNRIPELYHDFIVLINETKRLSEEVVYIDDKTFKLGVWNKEGHGTLQTLPKPYMTVDGRVLWARNEHREAGKLLNIHEPKLSEDGNTMTVVVESELLGKSVGIIELKNENKGVGKDNPFAVAQTSALGRALGFLGYGLIGTGISAEEIRQDTNERPVATTHVNDADDNEPKEVTIIAIDTPTISETYASFKGALGKETVMATIPISKKEVHRIKPGFKVTGHVWQNENNIRFSADNTIHVVDGVRRFEIVLDSSPVFSDDGSSIFHAIHNGKKLLVKAPCDLEGKIKPLLKGHKIKVDGLFIKGIIQLPGNCNIENLTQKVG